MTLTLEIMGPDAARLGAGGRKEFTEAGGTIGRQPDNSWVLQDPYVSSRHAVIRFADGAFTIEDKSTNGTFINSHENRLAHGQRHPLKSGDVIMIEPYEIRVAVTSGAQPAAADPFGFADPFHEPVAAQVRTPSPFKPPGDPLGELHPPDHLDPLKLISEQPDHPAPHKLRRPDLTADPVADHYEPPAIEPPVPEPEPRSADVIPDDYDPLRDSVVVSPADRAAPPLRSPAVAPRRPARRVTPAPAEPAAPAGAGSLADVLRGAGLTHVAVTPELARSFGEILQIVVAGVMEVLQARQGIREEFRMRVTTFKRADNNPLKFSANVDDALHNLLVKRTPGYLGPVEAFDDAFRDIRNHQIAMLAGMRAAFHAMLAEFDPDRLQEEFDRQLKKAGPQLVPAKMRYWELYREKVHDMVRDADAAFRELFGEQFADAYEAQLERLKAQSRSRER